MFKAPTSLTNTLISPHDTWFKLNGHKTVCLSYQCECCAVSLLVWSVLSQVSMVRGPVTHGRSKRGIKSGRGARGWSGISQYLPHKLQCGQPGYQTKTQQENHLSVVGKRADWMLQCLTKGSWSTKWYYKIGCTKVSWLALQLQLLCKMIPKHRNCYFFTFCCKFSYIFECLKLNSTITYFPFKSAIPSGGIYALPAYITESTRWSQ